MTKPKLEDLKMYDDLTIDGEEYRFACNMCDCLIMILDDDEQLNVARIFPEEYLEKCTRWYREDEEKILYIKEEAN